MPEEVGLTKGVRRRTLGLRREEVAQLSGVSITWYTWLEQGRNIKVSNEVLESISRVLKLTKEESIYLFSIAGNTNIIKGDLDENILTPSIKNLLKNIVDIPAYIIDQHWNLLYWNNISEKVFCIFNSLTNSERNIIYLMFTNKEYMDLFDNWEFHARGIISRLRYTYGKHYNDIKLCSIIKNLCEVSKDFNKWWNVNEVSGMNDVIKNINHPLVGKMTFEFISLDLSINSNLKLIFHNPINETKKKIDMLIESGN